MAVPDHRPIVLVVDDETLLRGVVRRALESSEISVVEAPDGEDALALLDRGVTVDLVLTDFMMARISGLQVMAVLARYRPELPIIGMTGHADPALREGAAKFGVRVLQKPFEIGTLLVSVREGLAERRNGRSVSGRTRGGAPATTANLVAAARALAPRRVASSPRRSEGSRTVRHVGRFGHRGFILRLGSADAPGSVIGVAGSYWEIQYEGRVYPWRPVHHGDESDLPQLMRSATAYLKGELQRSQ
jgi:CheY-like chemotaxis protein